VRVFQPVYFKLEKIKEIELILNFCIRTSDFGGLSSKKNMDTDPDPDPAISFEKSTKFFFYPPNKYYKKVSYPTGSGSTRLVGS
jgi:hypothetical protein